MEKKGPIELYLDRMRPMERRRLVRPMTSGVLIETATRLYQLKAPVLLGKTLLSVVPCYFALVFFSAFTVPALFSNEAGASFEARAADLGLVLGLTVLVAIPLFVFGLTQAIATTVHTVAPVVTGDENEPQPELKIRDLFRLARTLVACFLIGLLPLWLAGLLFLYGGLIQGDEGTASSVAVAMVGFLLVTASVLFCPAVLYRLSLAPVISLLEKKGTRASIKRGSSLLKVYPGILSMFESFFVTGIVIVVVGLLLYYGIEISFQVLGATDWGSAIAGSSPWKNVIDVGVGSVPGFMAMWFVVPFAGCASTLMYFDRRSRLEALDIRLLAKDLKVIDSA